MRLRDLPSVDELARSVDDPLAVDAARAVLAQAREEVRAGAEPGDLTARLRDELVRVRRPRLRRVLNATGVVVHTNLGRAPLAAAAIERVAETARGYSNLEYSLDEGARGSRQDSVAPILRRLTGAEAALVVNNNAGAVLLALTALADEREVIVSRGELIEIGDGFRIPDVLARSGARLVEVGTTNRTRAADYDRAVTNATAVVLRVHQSNFRVVGFAELPSLRDLAAVARRHGLPLVDDLGSGAFAEFEGEPSARESLAAGADLVCFSGDKLLGGPQAGIVVGRADLVERLRRHPLQRALRVDKLSLAALEATLLLYLDAPERIPVVRMLRHADLWTRQRPRWRKQRQRHHRHHLGRRHRRAHRQPAHDVPGRSVHDRQRGRGSGARSARRRHRPRRQAAPRLPHADGHRGRRGHGRGSRRADCQVTVCYLSTLGACR